MKEKLVTALRKWNTMPLPNPSVSRTDLEALADFLIEEVGLDFSTALEFEYIPEEEWCTAGHRKGQRGCTLCEILI